MTKKLFLLIVALMTILVLFSLVSCDAVEYNGDSNESEATEKSSDSNESKTTEKSNDSNEINTTENNNQSTSESLEKIYCQATLDDLFSDDIVLLVMFPEYNFTEYTVETFAYVGCIELNDLSIDPEEGKLCRILALYLDTHSKENVLNVIKILEERDDVYCAEPSYWMSVD